MNELELFAAAIAITDPGERALLLDRECARRPDIRQRIDQLLDAHFRSHPLLDRPGAEQTRAYGPKEQPGAIIASRYKLLEEVGEGGMGNVWVAEQTEPVKRKVALKLIKLGMDSKSVLARFEAERQALAVMDHPNIAKVLDGGLTETGRPFFVMEYVKGVPITEYCDAARLSIQERLQLFAQVCSAVQHAHQKGIIHRDLKPSNILVAPYDDKPVPKVIDFGLAKAMHQALTERTLHTAHETVLGTPLYMSPEQAQLNNLDVDIRSDIYSLGVVLYELLTGSTPLEKRRFKQVAWDEIRRIIREEEPPRPSARLSSTDTLPSLAICRQTEPFKLTKQVRGELDWIVMKALEKDRTRRYETANGFAMDLQRYLAGEPVLAHPPSTIYRLKKFVLRHRLQVIAASLVLVALLAGVIGTTWGLIQAKKANAELAAEEAKVQARFDLAVKAIETFHTGVSEDMLLKNVEFKELRTKLLKEAADFYANLEKLLAGQTDAKSRKALAAAYFQLGELTDKIGSRPEALAVHRNALALRRELATAEGADLETRLAVARSLSRVGWVLTRMGDQAGALGAFEEQRCLAERLEAEYSSHAAGSELAIGYDGIGRGYFSLGKMEEALTVWRKALATRQQLADANPATAEYQGDLAKSHFNIGNALREMGNPDEALTEFREAIAISQKLADASPSATEFQRILAASSDNMGLALMRMRKPEEALQSHRRAMAIFRKLVDANPAVTILQNELAESHNLLGRALARQQRFDEALHVIDAGLAIRQKLADDDPKNTEFIIDLGVSHALRGWVLTRLGRPSQAADHLRQATELWAKVRAPESETRFERSRALALLAKLGRDAMSGVTASEAAQFADQAIVSLRNAVATGWNGWNGPDELNEPDFDALRGRADFQKIAAEVGSKTK